MSGWIIKWAPLILLWLLGMLVVAAIVENVVRP